jgi:hypothetical protein
VDFTFSNKESGKQIILFDSDTGIVPNYLKYQWKIENAKGKVIAKTSVTQVSLANASLNQTKISATNYISDSGTFTSLKPGKYKVVLEIKYIPAGTEIVGKEDTIRVEKIFEVLKHGAVSAGIVDPQISQVSYHGKKVALEEDKYWNENQLQLLLSVSYAYKDVDSQGNVKKYFDGVFPDKYEYVDLHGKKSIFTSAIYYKLIYQEILPPDVQRKPIYKDTNWIKLTPKEYAREPLITKNSLTGKMVIYQLKVPHLRLTQPGNYKATFIVKYERGHWERIQSNNFKLIKKAKIVNKVKTYANYAKRMIKIKVMDITPPQITYSKPVIIDVNGNEVLPGSGDELTIRAKITDYKLDPDSVKLYLERFPYTSDFSQDKDLKANIGDRDAICKVLPMSSNDGVNFTAKIKVPKKYASKLGKHWEYFISASDIAGNENLGDEDIKDNNMPEKHYGANGTDVKEIVVNDNDPPAVKIRISNFDRTVDYRFEVFGGEENDNLITHKYAPIQLKINGKLYSDRKDLVENPLKNYKDRGPDFWKSALDIKDVLGKSPILVEGSRVLIKIEGKDEIDQLSLFPFLDQ